MPTINWVKIKTFLSAVGDAPENYIPIAAIPVDDGDEPDGFTSPTSYASTTEMEDDGWEASDDAYLAAAEIFGQTAFTNTPPTRVVVFKRAVPVAQVMTFTINDTDDGNYKLYIATIGGTAVEAATFAASGSTTTQIKDGLISSFNGGAFAASHTAASTGAATGTITADVAGVPFVLTATEPVGATATGITTTTPNEGLYDDLDTAWAAEPFWAVIPDGGDTEGEMIEAGRWAEASAEENSVRRNVALLQTADTDIPAGTEPNFASTLAGLNYTRSFPLLHANTTDKMTAAWFGRYGGQFPGTMAWHFGKLSGSTETTSLIYTQSEIEEVKDQRCAVVERDGPSAFAALRINWDQGAGEFFLVQKQAEDYWWLRTWAAVIAALEQGLNLDEAGINTLIAAVDGVNLELAAGERPVIDLARTTVEGVPLEDVPDAEVAVGDYYTTGGILVETVLIPKLRAVEVSATFGLV